jgi:hypothetical protein
MTVQSETLAGKDNQAGSETRECRDNNTGTFLMAG